MYEVIRGMHINNIFESWVLKVEKCKNIFACPHYEWETLKNTANLMRLHAFN